MIVYLFRHTAAIVSVIIEPVITWYNLLCCDVVVNTAVIQLLQLIGCVASVVYIIPRKSECNLMPFIYNNISL